MSWLPKVTPMANGEDTERVAVRTYVPAYQRDEWDDHADRLDMSRSEFVRTMVQAGRRGFLEGEADQGSPSVDGEPDGSENGPAATSGSGDLETRVVETLSADGYLSWDELLASVTDDVEDRLEATLQDLQSADRVLYSGRNGGYTLDE